ncbi:MAG TPA: TetR/AcrR family transcriptional regulator [Acidimicrobiales bacterium]|nr:TetR/AcrR family transcriptional regulator [Acidimicrobiales bacterium]
MTATASRPRRTQAERRESTQRAILDATIEGLTKVGYAQLSTNKVVRKAGVSRGALVHHFPTKADLAVAALDRWLTDRIVEFDATFAALRPEDRRDDVAIDILWEMFEGPTFAAWIELVVAARTDERLRPKLVEVNDRFSEGVYESFRRAFDLDGTDLAFDPLVAVDFAFTVLTGAATGRFLDDPSERAQPQALTTLKFVSALLANPLWRNQ